MRSARRTEAVGRVPDPRRAPWLGCRTRGSDAGEGARPTAPMPAGRRHVNQARRSALASSASRICNWRRPSANCGYWGSAEGSSIDW